MHIAIDARLNAYRQGGIPQYTRQLVTALAELARDDQITSLQHRDQLRPLAVAPNVIRRTLLTPPHHRFEQWTLPIELLLVRPDVLHCPDFIAPLRRPCPAVVTIHDLAFMHYPQILDDAGRAYYGQIKTNAARADGIIAVSEATRQDIAQFLDIPIEEIAMIHEAAAPLYGRLELRPGEARVLNATPVAAGTFMLFVSTLEPRKNLPTLLQALRVCIDRQPGRRYLLVVAGARGWREDIIFDTVRDLRLGDHVLFAGNVGQYDLRWLYNACRFYVNPSLYEGFGLPLLEAMTCGAACLAAATSSLPEIGGDVAIYVPPLDAAMWADAIEELWDDEERQRELGQLGRVQAQHFSWMRAARETLKVYERAIERARWKPAAAPAQERRAAADEAPATDREPALGATPLSESSSAVPGVAGEGRACLRCGTAMLAGQLQHGLAIRQPAAAADDSPLPPRVWACPRCGHVELVVEQAEVIEAPPDEAVLPAEAPASAEPGAAEDLSDTLTSAPAGPVLDDGASGATDALEETPAREPIDPALEAADTALDTRVLGELEAPGSAREPVDPALYNGSPDTNEDLSAMPMIELTAPIAAPDEAAEVAEALVEGPPDDDGSAAPQVEGEPEQGAIPAEAPVAETPPEPERPVIDATDVLELNSPPSPSQAPPGAPTADELMPTPVAPATTTDTSDASTPPKRRQSRAKRKRS